MTRGRLEPPNLDDRTWREIVDQARALIPTYAPQWTDHNPSDLGITLIELFAWLVEGMIYRLNRVPERSQIQFLNMLGITRQPAQPASAWLTFRLPPGAGATVVPAGTPVTTPQTEQSPPLLFETDAELQVLPVNLVQVALLDGTQLSDVTTKLNAKPLAGLSLSLAAKQELTVALGFDSSAALLSLHIQRSHLGGQDHCACSWSYTTAGKKPAEWPALNKVSDGSNHLQRSGGVQLTIPPDWSKQKPESWGLTTPGTLKAELFWLGLRIRNPDELRSVHIDLDHILCNSISATNALTITDEDLGVSTGAPFQLFELANRPLYRYPVGPDPYRDLSIAVSEPQGDGVFGPWTPWSRVEQFAPGTSRSYRLEPVSGTISFGNHDSVSFAEGHGSIPPSGSKIRATRYRYVGAGARGNVPPETITTPASPLGGLSMTNPGPARGGADEESTDAARRHAPELLRTSGRAVAAEDYEHLARAATPGIAQVRCLPPRLFTSYEEPLPGFSLNAPWTYGGLNRGIGAVNVIVVPALAMGAKWQENPRPLPSAELLEDVVAYLEPRRTLTSQLKVVPPRYLPVRVTVKLLIWRRAIETRLVVNDDAVKTDVLAKIEQFLHPQRGGPQGQGWAIGEDVLASDLLSAIKLDSSVGFIEQLSVLADTPVYTPPVRPFISAPSGVWVQIADYELVCSAATHTVTALVSN